MAVLNLYELCGGIDGRPVWLLKELKGLNIFTISPETAVNLHCGVGWIVEEYGPTWVHTHASPIQIKWGDLTPKIEVKLEEGGGVSFEAPYPPREGDGDDSV